MALQRFTARRTAAPVADDRIARGVQEVDTRSLVPILILRTRRVIGVQVEFLRSAVEREAQMRALPRVLRGNGGWQRRTVSRRQADGPRDIGRDGH